LKAPNQIKMVFLFQVMPHSSPTLCVEGGEFDPLLEVVWLHIHPFIDDEFASPSHVLVMGSPHGPSLTHLLSHILLRFSFLLLDCSHIVLGFSFCGVNNTFVNPFF
jgi:hypothetical protein